MGKVQAHCPECDGTGRASDEPMPEEPAEKPKASGWGMAPRGKRLHFWAPFIGDRYMSACGKVKAEGFTPQEDGPPRCTGCEKELG